MGVQITRSALQGGSALPVHTVINPLRLRKSNGVLRLIGLVLALIIFVNFDTSSLRIILSLSMRLRCFVLETLSLLLGSRIALSTPSGFPSSGNGLWYTAPGNSWQSEFLPIGNGYLAGEYTTFFAIGSVLNNHLILVITAMIPGGTDREVTQLNIESLWSGGPFEDPVSNDSLLILGSNR